MNRLKGCVTYIQGFPDSSVAKESTCNAGGPGFSPWVGEIPWRRERLPTLVSGLENSMNCIVHGVTKSWTQLSDIHFHIYTMECYSAIKRNKFESVFVRWMNPETVIQSEVGQKEKNTCMDMKVGP